MAPRLWPAALSTRLVLTAVALVALVGLLVAGLTTLAMRTYLTDRLDDQVRDTLSRAVEDGEHPTPRLPRVTPTGGAEAEEPGDDHGDGGHDEGRRFGEGPGTLTARFTGPTGHGGVITAQAGVASLTATDLDVLSRVSADRQVHSVRLAGRGGYRVAAAQTRDGRVVAGLPTTGVDTTVARLFLLGIALALAGVLVAAVLGTLLVRRQLRPLREVAATADRVSGLHLASGSTAIEDRVPAPLTDEHTEVGQVGAALNALLNHVETSLAARERSEQRVRQFVADASHELRTPLTTIRGYAELARRRPDDAAAVLAALDRVETESGRMTALVEDLLLLARLDSGRPLSWAPVDLSRLLVEAVSDTRVIAPDHVWRLDLPDEAIEVTGDEQRLHQVVTNLLTNARKYTPAGTVITVSAHADGRGGCDFSVHDSGPGFPPGLAAHAFDRFVRGDAARTRTAESGAGLGLALVEAIVSAHDGAVSLRSRPGDTTLLVRIPASPPRPAGGAVT